MSDSQYLTAVDGHSTAVIEITEVSINTDSFRKIPGSNGRFRTLNSDLLIGQTVSVQLPGQKTDIELLVESITEYNKAGVVTYSGSVNGLENDNFVISLENNKLMGRVVMGHDLYVIRSIEGGNSRYTVTWIDKRLMIQDREEKSDDPADLEKQAIAKKIPSSIKSSSVSANVRVLFLFGSNVSDPNKLASDIVVSFNDALENSGVYTGQYISIADVQVLNSTFGSDCRIKMRADMKGEIGAFSDIEARKAGAYADIVLSIAKGAVNITCPGFPVGMGRIGGAAVLTGVLNDQNPFATVADNYALADFTATHEIGHVLNGRHAVTSDNYSRRGIVADDKKEQSIMGGYQFTGCGFVDPISNGSVSAQTCVRLNVFSNQNNVTNYTNFADGSQIGAIKRDMADYLEDFALPTAAAFVANPPPPPSAPTLSVIPENCYGLIPLSWTSVANTTEYRLSQSSYIWFPYPSVIYTGTSTFAFVNITSSKYFKVQACNAGGCSAYSNQVSGSYFPGCL